jgi:RimJ/RimL family protein N-acetyltransferase
MNLYEVQAERLLLRLFNLNDVDSVFAYASDLERGKYLPVPQPYLGKDASSFVNKVTQTDWNKNSVWALVSRFSDREGEVSGVINLEINNDQKMRAWI